MTLRRLPALLVIGGGRGSVDRDVPARPVRKAHMVAIWLGRTLTILAVSTFEEFLTPLYAR